MFVTWEKTNFQEVTLVGRDVKQKPSGGKKNNSAANVMR